MSETNPQNGVPSSQTSEGPKAPEDVGRTKPVVEQGTGGGDDEEHGVPVKKAPSEGPKPVDKTAPKKEEPAPEQGDDDEDEKPQWNQEYISLPHEAGQSVIELLKESNVSAVEANAIFAKAIKSENLNDIDWDVLKSRLGDAKFKLAKIGIESYYNEQFKEISETVNNVHSEVGGEANWKKIAKWAHAKEAADPAFAKDMADLRKGVEAGGRWAKQAARDIADAYNADPKNKGLNTKEIMRGTTQAPASGAPMTRKEYHAAMHEGNASGKPASYYVEIRARRKAGMAQGI